MKRMNMYELTFWLGRIVVVCCVSACLSACKQTSSDESTSAVDHATLSSAQKSAWFVRPDDDRGIVFNHVSGFAGPYLMPEIMCGGAALFDMDNDGDLDAYLIQAGHLLDDQSEQPGNQLYRNDGTGRFTNATEGSGADDRGYGMGVACGDYDRDGDVDLYITNYGGNTLLQNDGDGTFVDVTAHAGVGHEGWGSSAAFFDYDRDGDLDLFVCNYLHWTVQAELDCINTMGGHDYCSPQNYNSPAADVLYRNDGDGTFTDVSATAGMLSSIGTGLGIGIDDFNDDGWLDVFVANDGMQDHLWINRHDGTFYNDALLAGCAVDQDGKTKAGMGVTLADIDDDGDSDLLVCNLFRQSDSLYRNDGGSFTDITKRAGLGAVSRSFTRFGMAWHDFNHDSWLDLYQANGRVVKQSRHFTDDAYGEPNLLFKGVGPARFEEVSLRGGTADLLSATSRAAAFGDVDNDGDIDILIVNRDARAHLLLNQAPDYPAHWIQFRLLDKFGSPALNAQVSLTAGDRRLTRLSIAAYSYQASNDPRVHFGLASHGTASGITVNWPDGSVESFPSVLANQIATLRQGQGIPANPATDRSDR